MSVNAFARFRAEDSAFAETKASRPPLAEKKRTPRDAATAAETRTTEKSKQQIVLVLQGGGALGAYQAGVYHGLCEGGVEPDWVIGTSIGAINGALIAGKERLGRLQEFWARLAYRRGFDEL